MSLYLSLGHNSSAVYFDGRQAIGYEEERLDRIKSSSAFPNRALSEIAANIGDRIRDNACFFTHWFDRFSDGMPNEFYGGRSTTGKMKELQSKYFDHKILGALSCEDFVTHSAAFTHHDAHANAASMFLMAHAPNEIAPGSPERERFVVFVADGFGNFQEVVSVYEKSGVNAEPKLLKRIYGYEKSLGLMYQFATAYCGMKENQDEYKFLGYESHLHEIATREQMAAIREYANGTVEYLIGIENRDERRIQDNELISFRDLDRAREQWYQRFRMVSLIVHGSKNSSITSQEDARKIVGYYIQYVLEEYFVRLAKRFNAENLLLSGGVFYNVKLNNRMLNSIDGALCVYPVAGDQGAAVGFVGKYAHETQDRQFCRNLFTDLFWGRRDLSMLEKKGAFGRLPHYLAIGRDSATSTLSDLLSRGTICNVVTNRMEFGPRALGATSSLMLPNQSRVTINNSINERNEVMPCAPIMRRENLGYFFDVNEFGRVIGSDQFMVVTYNYKDLPIAELERYGGVMHSLPDEPSRFSGRPQVIDPEHYLYDTLVEVENRTGNRCLVNTSFNSHGQPIVHDSHTVISNQMMQERIMKGSWLAESSKLVVLAGMEVVDNG